MSLTREEVLNVAKLARLEFKLEEIEKFQNELNDIIKYIDVLSEVNTDNVEPLTQVNDGVNNFREDEIKPSISVADAILNAPSSEDGAIIVPKVVGE
ncbi:MAG: Asp-tRNA(Asn)/Glu-tRNA(Gln) amidotransferase subunit GatC [Cetobacterium sp.]|uniref:Asp-tRNA(Asn)/Glu-tRNA(Gln) amidotransferase subunit GatC n=1 Tax=unclassified Cetobacterium TaxID=2630983 RepID=UPI00163BC09A|nr:Asp-tRNA(Asn)/Glu-tRNA(Gln) amidotransferase subunit GatC [Cetobacterium sp. 2A]MBC2855773.1 Asp-tRNA(Asn)/Glu-tRNA(Gln) amidotransferase subunit GatC [Cetobacterium sp. 2A]